LRHHKTGANDPLPTCGFENYCCEDCAEEHSCEYDRPSSAKKVTARIAGMKRVTPAV
jgi:hypothetical protein